MNKETKVTDEELIQMVKDGFFFDFCTGIALNKGFVQALKKEEEVKFTVGDYNVEFQKENICFLLTHKEYMARIIMAYINEVVFIGKTEEEIISELLIEAKKELNIT